MKVPLSVIIPIKNEAANLRRCLDSVAWADQIFVVDSLSNDGSIEIAKQAGAEVVQFEFNSPWPKKKNWALENLPFAHPWVLLLDADETLPVEAEAEIREIVTSEGAFDGYWVNRRFFFMGGWLRHAYYPNWNLRLFKHRLGRFEKLTEADTESGDVEIHEHVHVTGKTSRLRSEMDHYAFPSVETFVQKHNRYSNWEAHLALSPAQCGSALQSWRARARRFLKGVGRHLPCRPWLRFVYVYVVQGGFLDGRRGYYFARLHAFYEFLSVAKTYELREQRRVARYEKGTASARDPLRLLSWIAIISVSFFVLRPSLHGTRTAGMPRALGLWINSHDGLSNFLGFGFLGLLLLRRDAALSPWVYLTRLLLFCGFVSILEVLQLFSPGRVFDLRDIAAGCLGGLCAAFLNQLRPRRRKASTSLQT